MLPKIQPLQKSTEKEVKIRIRKKKTIPDTIPDKDTDPNPLVSNFVKPIEDFLSELHKTRDLGYDINEIIFSHIWESHEKMDEIIRKNITKEDEEYQYISLTKEEYKIFRTTNRDVKVFKDAPDRILRSFFISMFSLYEDFLANQIRIIYKKYPSKLQNDKQLVYEEFSKMTTLDEIQDYFIENSVRQIVSKDTLLQITELEKLLDIKDKLLLNNLPIKQLFEISARRNLVVHNESKINKEYINRCHKVDIIINDDKVGEKLYIDKDYFMEVFNILFESTMIISYLVWRKVFWWEIDSLEKIDFYYNNSCFELISANKKESINLPLRLLKFTLCNQQIKHKELDRLLFVLNYALCHKINWNEDEMHKVLAKEDWSWCHNWLQFWYYVLIDDYDECMKLFTSVSMPREVVKEKEIEWMCFDENAYHTFPIFYKLRENKTFQDKYKEVFWEEFETKDYD